MASENYENQPFVFETDDEDDVPTNKVDALAIGNRKRTHQDISDSDDEDEIIPDTPENTVAVTTTARESPAKRPSSAASTQEQIIELTRHVNELSATWVTKIGNTKMSEVTTVYMQLFKVKDHQTYEECERSTSKAMNNAVLVCQHAHEKGMLEDKKICDSVRNIIGSIHHGRELIRGIFSARGFKGLEYDEKEISKGLYKYLDGTIFGKKLCNFQKMYSRILELIRAGGYRRKGCQMYKRVIVNEGTPLEFKTKAWKPFMEISDYAYMVSSQSENPDIWSFWFANPTVMAHIITGFERTQEEGFPNLSKEHVAYSFSNGIYYANGPHGTNLFFTHETCPDDVVCTWHRQEFFDANMIDVTKTNDIATEALDTILTYQGITGEIKEWFYVFLGRLLYTVGEKDGWQVVPYLLGSGGCGKSTMIQSVVCQFFPYEEIGTLSSKHQETFAISQLYEKRIVVAPEMKSNTSLDQATFQIMASGERGSFAVKYKSAIDRIWKAPLIMAGNHLPDFKDVGGCVARRVIAFLFPNVPRQSDTGLAKRIQAEIINIIVKCNRSYLNKLQEIGSRACLWNKGIMPDYFAQSRNNVLSSTNSFAEYLGESFILYGKNKEDEQYKCPMNVLAASFTEWCRSKNYSPPKWKEELYKQPLIEKGITIEKGKSYSYKKSGSDKKSTTNHVTFCIGIDIANCEMDYK